MADFTATAEDFKRAHGDVIEIKGQIDQNLNNLAGNMEATSAGWQGELAARTFREMMDRYHERAMACSNVLANIAEKIEQAGQSYHNNEIAQQEAISHVAKGLDG